MPLSEKDSIDGSLYRFFQHVLVRPMPLSSTAAAHCSSRGTPGLAPQCGTQGSNLHCVLHVCCMCVGVLLAGTSRAPDDRVPSSTGTSPSCRPTIRLDGGQGLEQWVLMNLLYNVLHSSCTAAAAQVVVV